MKRSGQAAMEYLATYGWAVLIVVVIGAVIWQSGILSLGKNVAPGKSGFSQIRPVDWVAKITGPTVNVDITVINDASTKLRLTGASSPECTGTPAYAVDLLPGQTYLVTITGCSFAGNVGDYFRMEATLTYQNPSSGISHSSVGQIWGALE
jgi:hypothetical protein